MGLGQLLDVIKVWAESIVSTMGYPGLTIIMFLENLFPPIPSEIVLPLAGSLTLTGRFNMVGVVLWALVGALAGAYFFYGLGKLLGEERVRWLIGKVGKYLMVTTDDFDKSIAWFNRYGELVIFFGRMVPIVRTLISIPAGMASMNLLTFTFYTVLGTTLWNVVLGYAGRLLGQNWRMVADWINYYQNVIIVLAVAAVVVFFVYKLRQRRQTTTA